MWTTYSSLQALQLIITQFLNTLVWLLTDNAYFTMIRFCLLQLRWFLDDWLFMFRGWRGVGWGRWVDIILLLFTFDIGRWWRQETWITPACRLNLRAWIIAVLIYCRNTMAATTKLHNWANISTRIAYIQG